jgi:hypothetical protein
MPYKALVLSIIENAKEKEAGVTISERRRHFKYRSLPTVASFE